MTEDNRKSVLWAILAAALYAVSSPASKWFLTRTDPGMMAAFLYLGAGMGMGLLGFFQKAGRKEQGEHLSRKELPYAVGMVILDIAAPIFLMIGLKTCNAANVSLLNNFEIVATSLIAMILFREKIGLRLFTAICLITLSSIFLSLESGGSLKFSRGSLFVVMACISWGFENNCTRMMSVKDPLEIVVIKGFGSGIGSLAISVLAGEHVPAAGMIPSIMLLGFVAYGLSIFFYVSAQRRLGAAKTSAYYAVSPFIGTVLSLIFLEESPGEYFLIALCVMILGTVLVTKEEMAGSFLKTLGELIRNISCRQNGESEKHPVKRQEKT